MINTTILELNAATDPIYRQNSGGDSEYATLLGIQNVYMGTNRHSKIPMNVLLQANCIKFAKTAGLKKGRRFIVEGRLTFNEDHKSFTLKADQLTIFPVNPKGNTEEPISDEAASPAAESATTTKPAPKKK